MKFTICLNIVALASLLIFSSCRYTCDEDIKFKNKLYRCINVYDENILPSHQITQSIRYLNELTGQMPNVYDSWVTEEVFWVTPEDYQNDVMKFTKWYNDNKCGLSLSTADSIVIKKLDSLNHKYSYGCDYMKSYIQDTLNITLAKNELNEQSLSLLYEYGMLKSTELFEVDSMLKSYIEKLRINSFSFIIPGGMLYSTLIRIDRNKFFYFNFLDSVIIINNEDGLFVVYEYLQSSMLTKYRYCNFNDHLVRNNTFRHIDENWYGWSFIDVRIFDE